MRVLEHLEPKRVFALFEDMCAIPHGSFHTKAISDWCVAFARERGLEYHQDSANNVILIKPATPGYENAPAMILQGHLDMVCEKDADCKKDMVTEGLDLAVDGDWVYAKGTTLGGDYGIAVAMAMAILDDNTLQHPRIEAVFTTDEEVGMLGAMELDVSPLQGRKLLNIDSEVEGVFTVSCAGGCRAHGTLPVTREGFHGAGLHVSVEGLQGGHSGVEIHKGRANANVLLGRVLWAAAAVSDLRIVAVRGGVKDNVIPANAVAHVIVSDETAVRAAWTALERDLQKEFRVTDGNLRLTVTSADTAPAMDKASTTRVMTLLTCTPNGVQVMSADIEGLVQTSLNLGVLATEGDSVLASYSIRSSVESQKRMMQDKVICLVEQLGGTVELSGDYPGWAYLEDSPLRETMVALFREQYGREPEIEAIHAGLECGLFSGKMPGLDCVSIGPDLKDIHSSRERMSIASVQRVYAFVTELLRRSK